MPTEIQANRRLWDAWTDLHYQSEFYGVRKFREGGLSLPACDTEAVGPVEGLSLLHLQCHFGLDTLSWARLGARATGLDFSGRSIAKARELADECDLPVRFVEAEIAEAPQVIGETFDWVVTTAGVLPWLPDLRAWSRTIAALLRPGGRFYLREFHPVSQTLDQEAGAAGNPIFRYPYFPTGQPICSGSTGSYAVPDHPVETVGYEWPHTVAEVVQALLDAGLRLTGMREFAHTTYRSLPWLVQDNGGDWRWPGENAFLPLMYAIQAVKPAESA